MGFFRCAQVPLADRAHAEHGRNADVHGSPKKFQRGGCRSGRNRAATAALPRLEGRTPRGQEGQTADGPRYRSSITDLYLSMTTFRFTLSFGVRSPDASVRSAEGSR